MRLAARLVKETKDIKGPATLVRLHGIDPLMVKRGAKLLLKGVDLPVLRIPVLKVRGNVLVYGINLVVFGDISGRCKNKKDVVVDTGLFDCGEDAIYAALKYPNEILFRKNRALLTSIVEGRLASRISRFNWETDNAGK